jgi:hypothetical protein
LAKNLDNKAAFIYLTANNLNHLMVAQKGIIGKPVKDRYGPAAVTSLFSLKKENVSAWSCHYSEKSGWEGC